MTHFLLAIVLNFSELVFLKRDKFCNERQRKKSWEFAPAYASKFKLGKWIFNMKAPTCSIATKAKNAKNKYAYIVHVV